MIPYYFEYYLHYLNKELELSSMLDIVAAPLTEDFCGVEPVTHPPDMKELRPAPEVDQDKVDAYSRTNSAILGG